MGQPLFLIFIDTLNFVFYTKGNSIKFFYGNTYTPHQEVSK